MNTLLIITAIFLFTMQTLSLKLSKADNLRERLLVNTGFTFIATIGMSIYGIINPSVFTISPQTLWLGILFGLMFTLTIVFYNLAIAIGSLSYTAFYLSASMLIPVTVGIIGFSEPLKVTTIVAVLLFLVAFYFINTNSDSSKDKVKSTKKWVIFCILTFLCNGTLAVIQKFHQYEMNATQSSGLMLMGFAFATCFYGITYITLRILDKKQNKKTVNLELSVLANNKLPIFLLALSSLVGNLLLTYLTGFIDSSYLFPLVQGSIIVCITLSSVIFFKEKLSTFGKLGICIGILAIVIINF
ncbi:MAG: hypothetical protein RR444_03820 [Oscillospiraceae bacterium]